MNSAERATNLLATYMHQAFTAAGLPWDKANEDEVADIVDLIVEEAVEDLDYRVKTIEQALKKLGDSFWTA